MAGHNGTQALAPPNLVVVEEPPASIVTKKEREARKGWNSEIRFVGRNEEISKRALKSA